MEQIFGKNGVLTEQIIGKNGVSTEQRNKFWLNGNSTNRDFHSTKKKPDFYLAPFIAQVCLFYKKHL